MSRLFFVLLLIAINNCQSQDVDKMEFLKYQATYNYILNLDEIKSAGRSVYVSDTIVYIDVTTFWENLISENQERNKFVFKLDSIDNVRRFKPFHSDLIRKQIKSNETSGFTLYFSKVYDNCLIVELIANQGNAKFGYNKITAFNKSTQFLFKFDDKNQIISVYSENMEYD